MHTKNSRMNVRELRHAATRSGNAEWESFHHHCPPLELEWLNTITYQNYFQNYYMGNFQTFICFQKTGFPFNR